MVKVEHVSRDEADGFLSAWPPNKPPRAKKRPPPKLPPGLLFRFPTRPVGSTPSAGQGGSGSSSLIDIFEGDVRRLEPGEFLNDSLIDLELFRMHSRSARLREPPTAPSRVHVLSSLFWTKLAAVSNPKRAHAAVARWLTRLHLGEGGGRACEFLLVPVNERLHWALAVIDLRGLASGKGAAAPPPLRVLFLDSLRGMRPRLIDTARFHGLIKQVLLAEVRAKLKGRVAKEAAPQATGPPSGSPPTGPPPTWKAAKRLIKALALAEPPGVAQQTNTTDCGVYALLLARDFLEWAASQASSGEGEWAEWAPAHVSPRGALAMRRRIKADCEALAASFSLQCLVPRVP